ETTLVVFQRHAAAGSSEPQDNYVANAERKIVEKIIDLVEQFQDLGPRFHIEFLDYQEEGYQKKLADLREKSAKLAEAVESAPENSIFFLAPKADAKGEDSVQRLSFHDIYQLDKKASQDEGNLVLNFQGARPFANKILNIEEKRPRIAVGVVHEYLG